MATIKPRTAVASKKGAKIRPRARPTLSEAVSRPQEIADPLALKSQLDALITKTAIANNEKNAGSRKEGTAKRQLEALMNENSLSEHTTLVEFPDGTRLPYSAVISSGSQNYVDMQMLAKKCGVAVSGPPDAQKMFFDMISTSFKAVTDNLGANVCALVTKSRTTLPALSVGQKTN